MRIALVSPPFADASWPSIQLATLRAWLAREHPDVAVDLFHHSLDVAAALGPPVYDLLAWRPFAAEAVYAGARFEAMRGRALQLLGRELAEAIDAAEPEALHRGLIEPAEQATERLCRHLAGRSYDLIGISVCLTQLIPALHLAHRLKQLAGDARIVLGGSAVGGAVGPSLLGAFPDIDFVIDGEGERPIAALVQWLQDGAAEEPEGVPGLCYRGRGGLHRNPRGQLPDLAALPPLRYDEYFTQRSAHAEALGPLRAARVLVEGSRGCWWDRTERRDDQICAFCNLNLQWGGYREKSIDHLVEEIAALTRATRCLDVGFVDNILRRRGGEQLFERIAALGLDLNLSHELRASTRSEELRALWRAGGREVQVGIEALSSSLLNTMVKGTTAAQNVWMMRRIEELGLRNNANLILDHPGSSAAEVEETLRAIPGLVHLQPLAPCRFWLGHGSLVERSPERFGIGNVRVHDTYRELFPEETLEQLVLLERSYDATSPAPDWTPVEGALRNWAASHARQSAAGPEPILWHREGGDFLTLLDRRAGDGVVRTTTLGGNMAALYRYLRDVRTRKDVLTRFPLAQPSDLEGTLQRLADLGLAFDDEGRRTVALAVRPEPAGTRAVAKA